MFFVCQSFNRTKRTKKRNAALGWHQCGVPIYHPINTRLAPFRVVCFSSLFHQRCVDRKKKEKKTENKTSLLCLDSFVIRKRKSFDDTKFVFFHWRSYTNRFLFREPAGIARIAELKSAVTTDINPSSAL